MEDFGSSALRKNATELTVIDVYDIAAVVGREFERMIDQYGCEALSRLMPRVVRVLELLEVLVSRSSINPETEELRRDLSRLRLERNERLEKEKKHQKELELVEDVWRGEAQNLLSQITQLQAENKTLQMSLSLKHSPSTQEDMRKQDDVSEREGQVMKRLRKLVEKQRDEIRAKDHELTLKSEDVEALQMQQLRLMKINQDLRHRTGVVEAQGKAAVQQKAELEALSQARQRELEGLRRELARLREERHDWEQQQEQAERAEPSPPKPETKTPTLPSTTSSAGAGAASITHNSVWVECGGDRGFLLDCFESEDNSPLLPNTTDRKATGDEEEHIEELLWEAQCDEEQKEEAGGPDQVDQVDQDQVESDRPCFTLQDQGESDRPCFTLQELRDVLQERNELKAQVFVMQEELAYYKSEELEEEVFPVTYTTTPQTHTAPADQTESGIKRLIFTAVMPMVAAGLLQDDPTLLPIRRLMSLV